MLRPMLAALCLAFAADHAAAAPATGAPFVGDAMAAMMTDPGKALALAARAEAVSGDQLARARAEWLQGEALSRLGRTAEARPKLEQALAATTRLAPNDQLHGDILLSRGWLAETSGAIAEALDDFEKAYLLLRNAGEARGEAKALQNIAGIYQDAGDAARALRYYSQASDVYQGDQAFSIAAYNNVGESLRLLGRYRAAEAQYGKALKLAQTAESPMLQADVLTNLASTQLLRGNLAGASATARQALTLSAAPEAADERPFVYGVLAMIADRRGDEAQAARLIGRTFEGMDLDATPLPFREFHQLAANIYARIDRPDLAFAHLKAFKRLDDGVRALAASTNAALMAARFDFSNQNLRITQLQANRARLHELVLVLIVAAASIVSALLAAGLVSLSRSRNRVRAANGQLSQANASLEKALKVKSDFLAMTSHEIRTPLNGILGMTQVLLADRAVAGPVQGKLKVIHNAGEMMRALVDDILDLSKMETGKLVVNRGPVALPSLLEDVASLWRGRIEAKHLALDLEIGGSPALIEEDGDRLRQILVNLLSNAVKFTDRGKIALSAAVRQGGAGEELVFAVSDTGIGIAPEQQELVFEKFTQADASTSRRYGGTGLGLTICRNIALSLGGRIELASAVGVGSTFSLVLPLRRLEPPAPITEALDTVVRAPVLLLDPNKLTQRIIAKSVSASIGAVTCVADGEAALVELARCRFEHVIVQVAAAGRSDTDLGVAVTQLVRAAEQQGSAVTLLLASDDPVQPHDLPGCAIVAKPFTVESLLQALVPAKCIPSPLAA